MNIVIYKKLISMICTSRWSIEPFPLTQTQGPFAISNMCIVVIGQMLWIVLVLSGATVSREFPGECNSLIVNGKYEC